MRTTVLAAVALAASALNASAQTITYKLTYSGLEGTVTQAHVHFGKRAVNGGIAFFLCGTAAAPGPAGTPTCPADGTVIRTVTAADILGPTTQGIEAMNYDDRILLERYVEGRELAVTVMGPAGAPRVLPVAELVYGDEI